MIKQLEDILKTDSNQESVKQKMDAFLLGPDALMWEIGSVSGGYNNPYFLAFETSLFWHRIVEPESALRQKIAKHYNDFFYYYRPPHRTNQQGIQQAASDAVAQAEKLILLMVSDPLPGLANPAAALRAILLPIIQQQQAAVKKSNPLPGQDDVGFKFDANGKVIDPITGKAFVAVRQYAGLGADPDASLSPYLQVGIAAALVAAGVLLLSGKSGR